MKPGSDEMQRTGAIFAANRAIGQVAFEVRADAGRSHRGASREAGSLRVRFPSPEDEGLSAVLVNTAGGIAGGDRFDVDISVGAQARLTVTTAAAEKIYRSQGPQASIGVKLSVASGGRLAWLPQETILFDRAATARSFDVELAEDAALVMVEIVIFGRAAMGETMCHGAFVDQWRLRRGGRLVFAENVRLEGDIGAKLARPAIGNGAGAVATMLIAPGDEALVGRLRDATAGFATEFGASAWNGFAVLRFCAQDASVLRKEVVAALQAAGVRLPRLWLQ